PVEQQARQRVVTVGEDVGLHHHPLAHHPLDRKAAAVDFRADALDDDPLAAVVRGGGFGPGFPDGRRRGARGFGDHRRLGFRGSRWRGGRFRLSFQGSDRGRGGFLFRFGGSGFNRGRL
ncbi:hypothetical protein RZS08_59540, partial [Arthrospira platensis SPKY1]|nr:hypothetical protein [Arthrospira platensis SPKY1]